jgi:hypothetical protein
MLPINPPFQPGHFSFLLTRSGFLAIPGSLSLAAPTGLPVMSDSTAVGDEGCGRTKKFIDATFASCVGQTRPFVIEKDGECSPGEPKIRCMMNQGGNRDSYPICPRAAQNNPFI